VLIVYYLLVFGMVSLFAGSVIWALWWSLRGGQMSNFAQGAASIFDEDEPIGQVTDSFPGETAGREDAQ
jgi:cbb3-type cytochrome oxidase maturation protein